MGPLRTIIGLMVVSVLGLSGCASAGRAPIDLPAHSAGPADSVAVVLAPTATSTVTTDVANALLQQTGVRNALLSFLRSKFADTSESEATTLTTTVFVPYGAVDVSGDGRRIDLYGAACTAYWSMLGPVPNLDGRRDLPARLDVELADGSAKVMAFSDISAAYLDHDMGDETTATRAVPPWVLDRMPGLEPDWIELTEHKADDTTIRLVREWAFPSPPRDASSSLPPGYSGSPHDHPGIGRLRQLSAPQAALIFQRLGESKVTRLPDAEVDYSGPTKRGPVRVFHTAWNDDGDYSGIVNTASHTALVVSDGAWFTNPSWLGRRLIVDVITDAFVGDSPTLLHCEINWQTMKVLRIVPYGPLSPFSR